jgi:hypothetical protein
MAALRVRSSHSQKTFDTDLDLVIVALTGPIVELGWIALLSGAVIYGRTRLAGDVLIAGTIGMLVVRIVSTLKMWIDAAVSMPGEDPWRFDLSITASTFDGNEYLLLHLLNFVHAMPIIALLGAVAVISLRQSHGKLRSSILAFQGVVGAVLAVLTLLVVRVIQVIY